MKKWRQDNIEEQKRKNLEYYYKNKEKRNKQSHEYFKKHIEQYRIYRRRWGKLNRQKVYAKDKRWHQTEKGREYVKVKVMRRRARKEKVGGEFTSKDLRRLKGLYFCCVYCGRKGTLEVEHVIPLTRESSRNDITNMVLACRSCNVRKRDKTPEQWFKENPEMKVHFYKFVREEILENPKTGEKYLAFLPRTT